MKIHVTATITTTISTSADNGMDALRHAAASFTEAVRTAFPDSSPTIDFQNFEFPDEHESIQYELKIPYLAVANG